MGATGIVRDDRYMDHFMGAFHPESPKRLEAIYAMLDGDPEMASSFREVNVRRAEKDEILWVHAPGYFDRIAATDGQSSTYLDPDTQTSAGSFEAALLAAGGLCQAISMVHSGDLDNAFALVRPPGHHAEEARAMGFCLFNNVAVGARFVQQALGLDRVLIVDWDLHHGNGTQHSFEDDPSILYFSTHQFPFYPGTGAFQEVGVSEGKGYTVNIPLSTGCGDGEYLAIFEKILKPIANEFRPDFVLVSAGFDTHMGDPLGGMQVTPGGFAGMTRSLMDMAESSCHGKMVITLEGGYNVEGQRDSVKEVLKEMAGLSKTDTQDMSSRTDERFFDYVKKQIQEIHGGYWNSIA